MASTFDDAEGIVRRQMVLFFIVDSSGSMDGSKIGEVNNSIREVIPELRGIGGSDVELKIACLIFSNGCHWMHPSPVPVESFVWNDIDAEGGTDFGAACKELNDKLSKDKFLNAPSASVAPAIFLMSDGCPGDSYKKVLQELHQNNWFKYAIKVALAIGDDADEEVLTEFTGNSETVITAHNAEMLRRMIRFVTITSSQIGSKSQPMQGGKVESKQNIVAAKIQEEESKPDAWGGYSTNADDW